MKTALRLSCCALALGLIAYGLACERHAVRGPLAAAIGQYAAGHFIEAATFEGYYRHDRQLWDAYPTLLPGQVQLKDCKT